MHFPHLARLLLRFAWILLTRTVISPRPPIGRVALPATSHRLPSSRGWTTEAVYARRLVVVGPMHRLHTWTGRAV